MATQTPQKAREATLKSLATEVREAIADEARAALRVGVALLSASSLFTVEQKDEWQKWATTTTGKSFGTCKSYMASAKKVATLNKTQSKKVAPWTFEALQVVATLEEGKETTEVLSAIQATNPTPEHVREVRDSIRDSKLTASDRKEKATRQKENAASKTAALAEDIRKNVEGLARKSNLFDVMIGAVLLVSNGRKSDDVAAAIRLLVVNAEKAQKEREAQAKKDAAAAAALQSAKDSIS